MTKKKTFSVNEKYQFCQFSLQIQVMQIWCYVKKISRSWQHHRWVKKCRCVIKRNWKLITDLWFIFKVTSKLKRFSISRIRRKSFNTLEIINTWQKIVLKVLKPTSKILNLDQKNRQTLRILASLPIFFHCLTFIIIIIIMIMIIIIIINYYYYYHHHHPHHYYYSCIHVMGCFLWRFVFFFLNIIIIIIITVTIIMGSSLYIELAEEDVGPGLNLPVTYIHTQTI